uniref:RING-type domain-containing protein n=1 Tax=Pyrodinium bahamense TaxID=73915 RepID=A0A7S0FLM3_9DINO|mmetsp:Transcript_36919/g.102525  ORF Transcript_36919/g.102525 Transcript_36919/m.102525 type:complete len:277 (+) Transcript_36919:168-998(+)
MTHAQVGCNDAVLVLSLLYLSVDIQYDWESFDACSRPVHKWLLVSYALIVASRLIYVVGSLTSTAEAGDFLLNLRQKNTMVRFLNSFTWLIILPCFTVWSAIGTSWIIEVRRNTPQCLPNGVHLWFLIIWQVLGYLWIVIHCGLGMMAWFLERRLRGAEVDLQQIEDADVLSRWGQVSRLQGYTSMPAMPGGGGLPPARIRALPCMVMPEVCAGAEEDCPICLNVLKAGDSVRQLGACGHTFHRSCIDLWLLRRADCPLCKQAVKVAEGRGKGWDV